MSEFMGKGEAVARTAREGGKENLEGTVGVHDQLAIIGRVLDVYFAAQFLDDLVQRTTRLVANLVSEMLRHLLDFFPGKTYRLRLHRKNRGYEPP